MPLPYILDLRMGFFYRVATTCLLLLQLLLAVYQITDEKYFDCDLNRLFSNTK